MMVLRNKLCRNVVAAKFLAHLVYMFSVVARNRKQAARPKVFGIQIHTYLIQQRKNAERIALNQIKARLVVLVVYERPL